MSLLDSRLEAVLQLIPAGSILLDVGTDHCKLPAEAVRQGKAKKAYASDVKKGPLEAAKRQLTALGLEEKVVFTGRVSLSEYITYYKVSNVFLCMQLYSIIEIINNLEYKT